MGPSGRDLRLLVTEPLDGAANMALDEALLLWPAAPRLAAHAPLLRLGAAHHLAGLRPAPRRPHRHRRRGGDGDRPRAAGHGRQRHPPRGPRSRDHLQRHGGGGGFRGRGRSARDLPLDRRGAPRTGLRALGYARRDGACPALGSGGDARVLLRADRLVRAGGRRAQARGQRPAAAGRGLSPARRHHAGGRCPPVSAASSPASAIRWPT